MVLAASSFAQPPQYPPPQQPQQQGPWSEQPNVGQPDDEGNAPEHGVARISFMNGNVSIRRGDSADLVAAILNVPLTAGDRVVTGEGGRAEVQFDSANLIRLGPASEVRLSELERGHYQIQIAAGTTSFGVLRDSDAHIEISTPSVSVRPVKKGTYRVTVRPDGSSEITVRHGGEAEVSNPSGSQQLASGKTMIARGAAGEAEFQINSAIPEDDFDHWAANRDHELERSVSARNVSRDVYGAEDLDQNGRWVNDGSYGNVWVPTVQQGWAPYSCGRWVWTAYYGWTWLGCEPWAWAPYHYGRWYWGSYGWAWWPGSIYAPYFWRPALVGFFGWGAGFGFGFGYGHVGWVPLAPYEHYHAWYGGGVHNTVVNNVNVMNTYRNARVNGGISGMSSQAFGRSGVNSSNLARPTNMELARAGVVRGGLGVTPSRESSQFTNRAANAQGVPRTSENMRFFSNRQAPSTASRQMGATAQRGGGPAAPPAAGASNSGGINNGGVNNSGWQRFTPTPRSSGNPNMASPNAGAAGQGSRGFSPTPRLETAQPGINRSYSPAPQTQRNYSEPQSRGYSQPAPRGFGGQQPVHVNPPIVQPRSNPGGGGGSRGSSPAPRGNSGGGSRSGGGGGHSGGGHH
jgi:FecR protein